MRVALRMACAGALALGLGGCAGLAFNAGPESGALTYYEPKPYLLVTVGKDCAYSASVVSLPGRARSVGFKSGIGSADLSVSLQSGMIASVGQKTDTQIPQTLTAITGLATAASKFGITAAPPAKGSICHPSAALYEIVDGVPAERPIKSFKADVIPDPGAGS
jgi:hypothetical protein